MDKEDIDMKAKRIDMEVIMICAVMAIVGALGIVMGTAAFMGIRFQECTGTVVLGTGCTLWGLLWGILLIFNSNLVSKRG